MTVAEDFANCMTQAGIAVDATQLPDEQTLQAAIDYLYNWFYSLTPREQTAFDAATASLPGSQLLADSKVNVAPAIPGLLSAFDAASGYPLSTCAEYAQQCMQNAVRGRERKLRDRIMAFSHFTACVGGRIARDVSTMQDLGEPAFRAAVEVWNELGTVSQGFIELGGEAVGAFIVALFGEEMAAALLDVTATIGLGLLLEAIGECIGQYAVA